MIELIMLYLLGKRNMRNAIARGRKPGGFIALTIILWFGFEFIFMFILIAKNQGQQAYVSGIAFGAMGGLLSYLITKHCKVGTYVPPVQSENEKKYKW